MNSECQGDFYTFEGVQFYRCFLDFSVITGLANGDTCSTCRRTIDGIDRGVVTGRRVLITEVKFDGAFHQHSSVVVETIT